MARERHKAKGDLDHRNRIFNIIPLSALNIRNLFNINLLTNMSGLTGKVVSGAFWTTISAISEKVIGLATIAFLARLLEPKDFGIVAVTTIAIGIVSNLSDVGFEAAIIQRKKDIDDAASTAFFMVILLCSMNYGLIFFFSKAIATFYKDQMIENVLKILSLTLIIGSFTRIHNFLLSKELQFGKKTICEIVPNIVYGLVSIPLALWRYGVWSIVYGEIAKYVLRSLLLILLSPWQPTFKFDFKIAKDLIAYGKHVMLHNFLAFGSENIDNAIVGKYFGLTHLSFYKMSYNAAAMPTQILYQIIGRVTLPAFRKCRAILVH